MVDRSPGKAASGEQSIKILSVIVGADSTATCLNAAVLAAQSVGDCTIEALNVVVDPGLLVAASEEVDMQRLREHWEGTASERSAACHTAFVAWTAGAAQDAPPVAWRTIVGDEQVVVTQEANNADLLVVIAHERNMDGGDALHAALFDSQKPVLIVPVSWKPQPGQSFSRVAAGLSDSDAARRAIEAATPWLEGATDVTAIRIGDAGDPALKLPLMIDLGSSAALMLSSAYARDQGLLNGKLVSTAAIGGVDGVRINDAFTIQNINIEGLGVSNVPTLGMRAWLSTSTVGNVGLPLIAQFDVVFDVTAGFVWLRPLGPRRRLPMLKDRSGLGLAASPTALTVVHVAANSPAEKAGWAVGDRIVAVNGHSIDANYTRGELWQVRSRPAGTLVKLTMASGDVRELRLADYY